MAGVAALLGMAVLAAGCAAQAAPAPRHSSAAAPEPRTAAALLKIATVFNNDYDSGKYGPVYDRWDARSRAIITRADYIRRHTECPSGPQASRTEDAQPGPDGAWLVDYRIAGVHLTDYWFYVHGRWEFDLPLSNPGAAKLYKLPAQQYIKALGCAH